MSIEEIVEAVREDHDDDNAVDDDDDGPEIPKITVSMALQSINNLSLFLEQQAPTPSTQAQLAMLRDMTRDLNLMHIASKSQSTMDNFFTKS